MEICSQSGTINNKPALDQIMIPHLTDNKPLSEPRLAQLYATQVLGTFPFQGAEVIVHGKVLNDANELALEIAQDPGEHWLILHSYHINVIVSQITGNSTVCSTAFPNN